MKKRTEMCINCYYSGNDGSSNELIQCYRYPPSKNGTWDDPDNVKIPISVHTDCWCGEYKKKTIFLY